LGSTHLAVRCRQHSLSKRSSSPQNQIRPRPRHKHRGMQATIRGSHGVCLKRPKRYCPPPSCIAQRSLGLPPSPRAAGFLWAIYPLAGFTTPGGRAVTRETRPRRGSRRAASLIGLDLGHLRPQDMAYGWSAHRLGMTGCVDRHWPSSQIRRRHAAIDGERVAVDVRRRGRGEEDGRPRDLPRLGPALGRTTLAQALARR
jgi:hypothetical protein